MRARGLAIGYLLVQAAAFAGWWLALLVEPRWRRHFTFESAPDTALIAFAPADLAVVVASVFAASGLARRRRWAPPLVWLVVGAVFYAAVYCIAGWALTGDAALAAGAMSAAAAGSLTAALALAREPAA